MSDFEQDISENDSSVAKEDQVFFLYTQLMDLPFSQIENIIQLEHSLYLEHNANPQDRLAIIGLLQAQIMLGNYEKASRLQYQEIPDIEKKIRFIQENSKAGKILSEVVDEEEIAKIVARMTGIPVSRIEKGDREKVLELKDTLVIK